MKFIIAFCLLFLGNFKMYYSDKPVRIGIKEATQTKYRAGKYKSIKHFLDSICFTGNLSLKKKNIITRKNARIDTLYSKQGLKLVKSMGIVKQYYFPKKGHDFDDPGTCYSFLGIGNKCFDKDTVMCWQQFKYYPNNLITYNKSSFIMMKCAPYPGNCIGGACRVNFYPVIGFYGSDTSFHYFVNTDDIGGLRYSDINHDEFLDFLSIQSTFDDKDYQKLATWKKKYKNFECTEAGQCYKITALSFKKGKWETLKDKNGEEYFMLIKLNRPLDENSSFELLMSNWP
ncbi:hypothetical protein DVR12_25675 [Chitinophaga silvatica]|uniref:Uncharacterized protein n=1 Tax=Chitinophaga silvatica TaxID=2282649 RepID=A0A3E1Y2W3_9BACT|nr:hypothetical protein [Chitinophaga silvatica]RFS18994.1 hypothetical protein DVR12_25675 [Chitinophaga silvatica]